jgi:hypothetical protein
MFPLQTPLANDDINVSGLEEILDQSQENTTFEQSLHSDIMLAQSFTPSKTPLTKIDININKPRKTTRGISVSIRRDLNGSNLIYKLISAEDIPFFNHWIEVDFPDIDVEVDETYYIVIISTTPSEEPYRWTYDYGEQQDPYTHGKFYRSADNGKNWETIQSEFDFVDASFRTYTYKSHVDLICNGFLNWTANISGNKSSEINVSGSFTVQNNGTPYSRLNWKIVTWPGWGAWHFSRKNQTGLRPEDGPTTISVFVEGPRSNIPDTYEGTILIRNEDDYNDTCEINARLVTPKNKNERTQNDFFTDEYELIVHFQSFFKKNVHQLFQYIINPFFTLIHRITI